MFQATQSGGPPLSEVSGADRIEPGRTWVTRHGVHVDRMASAWLIRRFIDPQARFKFVAARGYRPEPGELRFDMFEAEFSHEGDRCSFEVLVELVAVVATHPRGVGLHPPDELHRPARGGGVAGGRRGSRIGLLAVATTLASSPPTPGYVAPRRVTSVTRPGRAAADR